MRGSGQEPFDEAGQIAAVGEMGREACGAGRLDVVRARANEEGLFAHDRPFGHGFGERVGRPGRGPAEPDERLRQSRPRR